MTIYGERKMADKKHYNSSYRQRLLLKINRLGGAVFTRKDICEDRSNRSQLRLNRALIAFINQGIIAKVSHGIYVRTKQLDMQQRNKITVLEEPFESVATVILNMKGVKWELGSAIQAYNNGESTQVPAVFTVRLHSRFRGSIRYNGRSVLFEGGINAR